MHAHAHTSAAPASSKPLRYATYKGRPYVLVFQGPTNYGVRAKLAFLNGAKEFWVAADQIEACDPVATGTQAAANAPSIRPQATPQAGFVADLPLPQWPCDTPVLYLGNPYRFQLAMNTKRGPRARIAYVNADGDTRERVVDLDMLELSPGVTGEPAQHVARETEAYDDNNLPPPDGDFVPDDDCPPVVVRSARAAPQARTSTTRKCDVCGDRAAEVPHPESPDAMLCQQCFVATDVPF